MTSDPLALIVLRTPMARVLAMVPDLLNYTVTVHARGMSPESRVAVFIQWGDPKQRDCEHFHGETEHDCWVKALEWFEGRAAKEAAALTAPQGEEQSRG